MKAQMMILLMLSTLLAGCADAIPDPNEVYSEDEWLLRTRWFTL